MYHHGDTSMIHFSSVQSLRCVRLFVTPWTATDQASLSIINSHEQVWKGKKMIHIEAMNYLVHLKLLNALCLPLLAPSISPHLYFPTYLTMGRDRKDQCPGTPLVPTAQLWDLKRCMPTTEAAPSASTDSWTVTSVTPRLSVFTATTLVHTFFPFCPDWCSSF